MTSSLAALPPGLVLIVGAFLLPLLRGRARSIYMLLLPALGIAQLVAISQIYDAQLGEGVVLWSVSMFGYDLDVVRVDRLSLVFGYIFHIAGFLSVIYALRVRDWGRRGLRGRSDHPVRLLGAHRHLVGLPDMGESHRALLPLGHALPDRSGGFRGLAPGRRRGSGL